MKWFGGARAARKVTNWEEAVLDLKQRGDDDGAEELARNWVDREPAAARAWQLLAQILLWRRKYAAARPVFEEAVRLDVKHTATARRFVLVLERLGERGRAEDFLHQASCAYFSDPEGEKAGEGPSIGDRFRTTDVTKRLRGALRRQDYRLAKNFIEALSKERVTGPEGCRQLALGEASIGHPHAACFWASETLRATNDDAIRREMVPLLSHHRALVAQWGGEEADQNIEARKRERAKSPLNGDLPLILISQVQRSGGTLLAQLFDGHPEQHVHPYELKVGFPTKEFWLRIPRNANVEIVRQWMTGSWIRRSPIFGYRKESQKDAQSAPINFCFANDLFQDLFESRLRASEGNMTDRSALGAYFSALFSAWFERGAEGPANKRFVTAFVPRLSSRPSEVSKFFECYPDGRLIMIIRDPRAWYASARRHHRGYENIDQAIETWLQSASAIPQLKKRYKDKVLAISYEDLVSNCEATMRRLCDALGLSFQPSLLAPTIGGQPAAADSSYHDAIVTEVHTSSLTRFQTELSSDTIADIERVCWGAYEEAKRWAL